MNSKALASWVWGSLTEREDASVKKDMIIFLGSDYLNGDGDGRIWVHALARLLIDLNCVHKTHHAREVSERLGFTYHLAPLPFFLPLALITDVTTVYLVLNVPSEPLSES